MHTQRHTAVLTHTTDMVPAYTYRRAGQDKVLSGGRQLVVVSPTPCVGGRVRVWHVLPVVAGEELMYGDLLAAAAAIVIGRWVYQRASHVPHPLARLLLVG